MAARHAAARTAAGRRGRGGAEHLGDGAGGVAARATRSGRSCHAAAIDWLMGQTGKRNITLPIGCAASCWAISDTPSAEHTGWPLIPGAAAWVTPTLYQHSGSREGAALQAAGRIQQRIEIGPQFCWTACAATADGITAVRDVLGVDADSYPETTGQALLALHRVQSSKLEQSTGCGAGAGAAMPVGGRPELAADWDCRRTGLRLTDRSASSPAARGGHVAPHLLARARDRRQQTFFWSKTVKTRDHTSRSVGRASAGAWR